MKKTLVTFLLTHVTAQAVNAQYLVGKQWCTVLNNGKAKVDVDYEIRRSSSSRASSSWSRTATTRRFRSTLNNKGR